MSFLGTEEIFCRSKHVKFFKRTLEGLPSSVAEYDCHRVLLAFFCLSGLDILKALDTLTPEFKQEIIEWIYSLQVPAAQDRGGVPQIPGFLGTSTFQLKEGNIPLQSHLTMTYTALASLIILGDKLSRVNKEAVLKGVSMLQQPNGSFCGTLGEESDMRFVYSAACVAYILNDTSTINLGNMTQYIQNSIGYEGAMGQGPGLEAHGGSTFCALAALRLTDRLNVLTPKQIERCKRWCINRQVFGFQGRPNKPEDTCYSFWVAGSLALLDSGHWVSPESNREFVLSTQDNVVGGFAKWPDSHSEPLHAFFGLAGLSLNGEEGLNAIEPLLCITHRAMRHLKDLHKEWTS